MRLVIDTNIVASAAFFDGLPERLINLVLEGQVTAVVSKEISDEYEATISRLLQEYRTSPFRGRFPFSALAAHFDLIMPSSQVKICSDPDDDKFIACALDGLCPFIVSGDRHLLNIKQYGSIKIIKVRDFFDLLENGSISL